MWLKSITSFDDVDGILKSVFAVTMNWDDYFLQWDSSSHGNITTINIDTNLIWTPMYFLKNPVNKIRQFGSPLLPATVQYDGHVYYHFLEMLHTKCDVDITYFPFDIQYCDIELVSHIDTEREVNPIPRPISLLDYTENNLWILRSTSAKVDEFGFATSFKFTLCLERRYSFFILNLFSPVLFLVLLNVMVFILPPDSGERIGYAITCLLSLSVYMTYASDNLPTSSKPIAVITYVLLSYMDVSAFICFATILSLQFHHHDSSDLPPYFLIRMCCAVNFGKKKEMDCDNIENTGVVERKSKWNDVAKTFDKLCFVASILCIFLVSISYFIYVKAH